MKKIIAFLSAALIMLISLTGTAAAFEPYQNYTYTHDMRLRYEPQAFIVDKVIDGEYLGVGDLLNPSDVFEAPDGRIYIADTGNNRILVLDDNYNLVKTIESFINDGETDGFNQPQGLFVTPSNYVYIADTENSRIVVLDGGESLIRVLEKPEIPLDQEDFNYKPIRVSVDRAGRLFIVSQNVNKGMIELDADGNFVSFFGAITVPRNFIDLVWRRILTQEQIDRSHIIVPTEYSSCDIDSYGFVYGTVSATGRQSDNVFIRRLNPRGIDVLRRNWFFAPRGDIHTTLNEQGIPITSRLIDISVGPFGMYSVLDSYRCRVFVYDQDGHMLFVFGAPGNGRGQLSMPRALEWMNDGRIIVADGQLSLLIIYKPTEYADLVMQATIAQYDRRYEDAQDSWQDVLNFSTSLEIAYIGMGKALFRQGDFKESMYYFKLGNDRALYSRAYSRYRSELMAKWFVPAMNIALVSVLALAGFKVKRYIKTRRNLGEEADIL